VGFARGTSSVSRYFLGAAGLAGVMGRARIAVGGLAALVVAVGAVAGVGEPAQAQDAGQDRPNVVVVMTDDQHAASLAAMPRLNAELVAEGASFANSFTNWPLCCPSRATFYTGQYAVNHGVIGNSPPNGGWARLRDDNTLPVWLKQAGYRTIHVGKYLNGYGADDANPTYVPPGWDEWYAATQGTVQSVYNYVLNSNGQLISRGQDVTDFKQDVFTDYAVDAINRNIGGGPLFLGVMYTAPHGGGPNPNPQPPANCGGSSPKPAPRHANAFDGQPLPVGASFNEADMSDKPAALQTLAPIDDPSFADIRRRWRCRMESILSVDDGVGRIVDALRASGELDNTLIIFTSDNGFFHGEHRVQAGKNRVYEESIRVPLVMRGPGIPQGVGVRDLAINADLAPTILDAANAPAGLDVDGRSLLSFAEHPLRYHGREFLIQQGDGIDDEDGVGSHYDAIRTSRYIYVQNAGGTPELYDLDVDPLQLQNQAANPAYDAAEAALAARLSTLRNCAGASCRTKPSLKLKVPRSVRQNGRSCRRPRDFVARVRGADSGALAEAAFAVGSKPAGSDRTGPFKKEILPRLLRAKRRPEVTALAELVDGRLVTVRKRVRICR
jgi:arylsulfatase A-like enzyme